MKTVSGKTAVVIGGGGGVGRGVCLGLAHAGANVVVADLNLENAQKVADELMAKGVAAKAYQVDATSLDSLPALADSIVANFSGIDVLVNAVGVVLEKKLEDVSLKDWEWIWGMNVLTQVNAVNVFLPYLRKSEEAYIVLTGSPAALIATSPDMKVGAYAATKHALAGYAKALRGELADEGIGVSLLCPSGVAGNLAETSAASYRSSVDDAIEEFGGKQLEGRILADGEVLGPLTVAAIEANSFIISNKKDEVLEAIKAEYESLLAM